MVMTHQGAWQSDGFRIPASHLDLKFKYELTFKNGLKIAKKKKPCRCAMCHTDYNLVSSVSSLNPPSNVPTLCDATGTVGGFIGWSVLM